MTKNKAITTYSPREEFFNIVTHGFGLVASLIGLLLLILKSSTIGSMWYIISFVIYGISLVTLYAASTFYHASKEPLLRYKLNIFDHASIYILIAGTYTPFALITLHGKVGWWIFGVNWTFALTGIILKLFFTGKYTKLSTLMYVLMGWMIVFAINPLISNLSSEGLFWLVTGGVLYTLGAVFFMIEKLKFNHVIFHVFVLLGSFTQFISVYYYV